MKINLNRAVKLALASTLVLSLALAPNVANAKRHYRYHYRTSRPARKIHYRRVRGVRSHRGQLIAQRYRSQQRVRRNLNRRRLRQLRQNRKRTRRRQRNRIRRVRRNWLRVNRKRNRRHVRVNKKPRQHRTYVNQARPQTHVVQTASPNVSHAQYWDQNGYPTHAALSAAAYDLAGDVNRDRAAHGLSQLSLNHDLEVIAQQRADQTFSDGFTHYDPNGGMYLEDDANRDGDSLGTHWAENLSNIDGYQDQTPQQIADVMNKILFTDEKGATPAQDGGHRKNILTPDLTNEGVEMQTDGNGNVNAVEDFDN